MRMNKWVVVKSEKDCIFEVEPIPSLVVGMVSWRGGRNPDDFSAKSTVLEGPFRKLVDRKSGQGRGEGTMGRVAPAENLTGR